VPPSYLFILAVRYEDRRRSAPSKRLKENLEFVRQRLLGTIELWAEVLSRKKHAVRGDDAHRLLRLFGHQVAVEVRAGDRL
jgi:hypothetical protein